MMEALFGSSNNQSKSLPLLFACPITTYSTNQVEEVVPLLRAVEAAVVSGSWAVLMLSYEAAPAFDGSFKTQRPGPLPLAWAAVFDKPSPLKPKVRAGAYSLTAWEPQVSRPEYGQSVCRVRELIAKGDTYQVNYTFPLGSHFTGDSRTWHRDLCDAQNAEYCVYLDLGRYKILSLSPELFFERRSNSTRTKPMKGTIKRGRWSAEDNELAGALAESEKERAENVMIVDLLRNDLGKVSIPGSVRVSKLFEVEQFQTLWQMTSTVESTVRKEVGLTDLMAALFPCGSITGAPKIRTMEIIRELERFPRGVYTGTIGFVRPGGDCVFNVAIRTVVLDSFTGDATFGVGGGITIDSTAEREYEESLLKASFLNVRLHPFDSWNRFCWRMVSSFS